jgi:hypothetical protein
MDIDIPDMRHILGKASRKPTLGEFLSTPVSVGYGRGFDGHPKPTAGSLLIYTSLPETHFHAQSVTFPGCS